MPFPAINYCLVCEGIRQEMAGKLSVLGFFGVTPNVDIWVGRLDLPAPIVLVMGFGPVTDNQAYSHTVSVTNPDGSILLQSPEARINTVPNRAGLIVSGAAVVPRIAGVRTVRVTVNGQLHFQAQFNLRQATPQEIAGLPGAPLQ